MILGFLALFILKLFGWKPMKFTTQMDLFKESRAICIYPHTSKWDSVIFGMYFLAYPKLFSNTYTLFAARFFKAPLKWFLETCHCIPIENQKRQQGQFMNLVNFLSWRREFILLISPKGSSGNGEWRTGYLRLAETLNCPIIVCGLDYREKIPIVAGTFQPHEFSPELFRLKMKEICSLYPENESSIYGK